MNQTNTIHSVDTGLIHAVSKLSISKQRKIWCFNVKTKICHCKQIKFSACLLMHTQWCV